MADAPILNLEVVQRCLEVTAGTLLPATARVPVEPGSVKLITKPDVIRRRYTGSAATSHQSSRGLVHAGVSWDQRGFYDELAVLLGATLAPTVTGTGAQADKTWAFTPSDSVPNNLLRHSLELGGRDTWAEEERLAGCVVKSLELTWNKSDDWMFAVEYMALKSTQGAKAAALTMPATLVPILGRLTKVYIDASTFGSTAVGTAVSGKIKIENDISERFLSDGNEWPARLVVKGRTVTASIEAEYNATALRAAWRAATLQKLRISNVGPVLGSSFYSALFDIPGSWETSELGDDDGILTLAHDLYAQYEAGLTADISATVVCSIAAVP